MKKIRNIFQTIRLLAALAVVFVLYILLPPVAAGQVSAVVLVNSDSPYYADFGHYIQPYLDNFGIPYTVHDVVTDSVTEEILDRSLIIIGHNGLDETGTYLDSADEGLISAAVFSGVGLVNFDSGLTHVGLVPKYQYVQDVFNFAYMPDFETWSIEIGEGNRQFPIPCWDDEHQEPQLVTFTDTDPTLLNDEDGQWDEFYWISRSYPTILSGHDEWESNGLQPIHFFAEGIPNGSYEVWANLYTGRYTRHYYGFTEAEALAEARWVDNVAGAGGADQHEEYYLGTVEITDGCFDLWAGDGDVIDGTSYFYGWAWVSLVPEEGSPFLGHYITECHEPYEIIELKSAMPVIGLAPPGDAQVVAAAQGRPFIVAKKYGQGKAVQWGSYAFTQLAINGQVYGLGDLVWRSLVWAERKPFAMQGIPPLLTFRVDDCSGPFWWAKDSSVHGLKPWLGLFLYNIDETDTADIKALIDNGDATASIHAFTNNYFFYYNHGSGDYTDAEIAAHFAEGTQWHQDNLIPISKFVLGHYYELGTNAFDGLENWGVEFVGTHMTPGTGYGSPWLEI